MMDARLHLKNVKFTDINLAGGALTIGEEFGPRVDIFATDEQLAQIAEVIQEHLSRNRAEETPDQQMILNHEYEVGEAYASSAAR